MINRSIEDGVRRGGGQRRAQGLADFAYLSHGGGGLGYFQQDVRVVRIESRRSTQESMPPPSGAPALQARRGHEDVDILRRRFEGQPLQFPPAPSADARLLLGHSEVDESRSVVRIEFHGPSQQVPALRGRSDESCAQAQRSDLVRIESQGFEAFCAGLVPPTDVAQAGRQEEMRRGGVGEGDTHAPGLGERALRLVRVTQKDDPVPGVVEVRLVPGSPRKDIVQRVFHYYSSGGVDRCREVYHGSGPGGFGGDPLQMYSKNLSLHVDGQSSSPS